MSGGISQYKMDAHQKTSNIAGGLASVASGMLEAAAVVPQRKEAYQGVAHRVLSWLIKYAWNNKYFVPILSPQGQPILQDYMVRSDAWVFNAIGAAQKYFGTGHRTDIAEQCFCRMESVDFSGLESHASGWLKKLFLSGHRILKHKFATG